MAFSSRLRALALVPLVGACYSPNDSINASGDTGTDSAHDTSAGVDELGDTSLDPGIDTTAGPSGDDATGSTSIDPTTGASATDTTTTDDPTSDPTSGDPTGGDPTTSDSASDDATTSDDTTTGVALCEDEGACVEVAAAGWSGPATLHTTAADDPVPSCGPSWSDAIDDMHADLSAPPASCECSCGDPVGESCGSMTLRNYGLNDPFCVSQVASYVIAPGCNNIPNASAGSWWRITDPPEVVGGACAANLEETITPAAFDTRITACGGTDELLGCGAGESCVPTPDDPDDRVCIWQDGDVPCPVGSAFSDRAVRHRGIVDTRDCGACTCGDPVGTCYANVALMNPDDCLAMFFNGTIDSNGACEQDEDIAATGGVNWSIMTPDSSCTASPSAPLGAASASDPVTTCCMPS